MNRPVETIKSLEDVKLWIAAEDAKNKERWTSIFQHRDETNEAIDNLGDRMTTIEKKVVWVSGGAAALLCSQLTPHKFSRYF